MWISCHLRSISCRMQCTCTTLQRVLRRAKADLMAVESISASAARQSASFARVVDAVRPGVGSVQANLPGCKCALGTANCVVSASHAVFSVASRSITAARTASRAVRAMSSTFQTISVSAQDLSSRRHRGYALSGPSICISVKSLQMRNAIFSGSGAHEPSRCSAEACVH